MSLWTTIRDFFGSFAGSAVGGAATGGVLPTVEAGAKLGKAGLDTYREGKRDAQDAAIAKESASNDAAIDAAIRKATQTGAALALAGILALGTLGCASTPSRSHGTPTGNVERLLARPDFSAAAKAAPEWTRDSLKTVNGLEADLQRERARANRVN